MIEEILIHDFILKEAKDSNEAELARRLIPRINVVLEKCYKQLVLDRLRIKKVKDKQKGISKDSQY